MLGTVFVRMYKAVAALTLAPAFWALPPALGAESGVALDPVHHASPRKLRVG